MLKQRTLTTAALAFGMALLVLTMTGLTAPLASPASANEDRPGIPVLTRNLDAGTDFGPVFAATSTAALLAAVVTTYAEVQASTIPERAAAVAREIGQQQPLLVGLQEVSLWRTGPLFQPTPSATTVTFDALQSLLDALAQQGLHYAPLAIATNSDAELPDVAIGADVRTTDRDVLLVRMDLGGQLEWSNIRVQHFTATLTFPSPTLGNVRVPRSWLSVDVTYHGKAFRFITTHLESVSAAIQAAQGAELVQGPGMTTLPVVLAGDFNAAAVGGPDQTPTYGNLLAAGFRDAWSATHPATQPGYTWPLHGEDPYTPRTTPTERIDLVLLRNGVEAEAVQLIGNRLADRTPSGLWPSDHAGVVAVVTVGQHEHGDADH
ncbi:MAG: endonuclease/exonuclease/phosphatase family protein [Dehalococcoidia bacterium]